MRLNVIRTLFFFLCFSSALLSIFCSDVDRINIFDPWGDSYFPLPIDSIEMTIDTQNINLKWQEPLSYKGPLFTVYRSDSFINIAKPVYFSNIGQTSELHYTDTYNFNNLSEDGTIKHIFYQIRTPFDDYSPSISDTLEIRLFRITAQMISQKRLRLDFRTLHDAVVYEVSSPPDDTLYLEPYLYPILYYPIDSTQVNSLIILRVDLYPDVVPSYVTYFCGWLDSSEYAAAMDTTAMDSTQEQ
jgi:hypothetical protein